MTLTSSSLSSLEHQKLGDLDATHYQQHSQLQSSLAQELLQTYPFKGNEWILDVGCGDGKITAQIALKVPFGHHNMKSLLGN